MAPHARFSDRVKPPHVAAHWAVKRAVRQTRPSPSVSVPLCPTCRHCPPPLPGGQSSIGVQLLWPAGCPAPPIRHAAHLRWHLRFVIARNAHHLRCPARRHLPVFVPILLRIGARPQTIGRPSVGGLSADDRRLGAHPPNATCTGVDADHPRRRSADLRLGRPLGRPPPALSAEPM